MNDDLTPPTGSNDRQQPTSYPVFRAPTILIGLVAVFIGIHLARELFFDVQADFQFLANFALIPARYGAGPDGAQLVFPYPIWGAVWTPLSYIFLHGGWMHLVFNSVWLLAFGTPVARRLGTLRFIGFFLVCGIISGIVYATAHVGEFIIVVGASGAISGIIAGAALFVFESSGPLARFGFDHSVEALRAIPRRPAHKVLSSGPAMMFVGVWLGLALLMGFLGVGGTMETQNIAWEAHIAGFVAGILLFRRFDPGVEADE